MNNYTENEPEKIIDGEVVERAEEAKEESGDNGNVGDALFGNQD